MLQSMTGFGSAQQHTEKADIRLEIKTLNAKQADVYLRLPAILQEKEIEFKSFIISKLHRGKISVTLHYQPKDEATNLCINHLLLEHYYRELTKAAAHLGTKETNLFQIAVGMPDVLAKNEFKIDVDVDLHFSTVLPVLEEALANCIRFRKQEGKALKKDLLLHLERLEKQLEEVGEWDPQRIEKLKKRLKTQVDDWKNNPHFDPNRFEQELIYYLEKIDITEEKVRLKNHLVYFKENLTQQQKKSIGKKLGFIAQEMGREINTIGAKANDAQIQHLVVGMKEDLDKIKEQLFNVL